MLNKSNTVALRLTYLILDFVLFYFCFSIVFSLSDSNFIRSTSSSATFIDSMAEDWQDINQKRTGNTIIMLSFGIKKSLRLLRY